MTGFCHISTGLDTAAKSSEQHNLQPVPRLRPSCAGITFEGRVVFPMKEIWKPVVGYESFYDVSNLGRVRTSFDAKRHHFRFRGGRILKQHLVCRYYKVALCGPKKKFRTVHTLVLEAFSGPRPAGLVSRHIDGNAFNNASSNLTWGTQRQNVHDKKLHGTQTCGSRHGTSKVSESDVIIIRKLRTKGLTLRSISDKFPISCDAVHNIVRRKTWTHI